MRCMMFAAAGAVAATLLLAGCPKPPPQPGPPPTPKAATTAPTDESETPPAPVLPDPRPNLPPATAESGTLPPATPSAHPVRGEQVSGEVVGIGPDDEPASGLEVKVYSVQVFTSSTQRNADAAADRVRRGVTEPVEVVQEADGKWRVYVGRSADRTPIDALRDRLNAGGEFTGCWTKQRLVRTTTPDVNVPVGQSVYSVQVFVSSTRENAQRTADEVRSKTRMQVEVVQIGSYWKVFVGRSVDRDPIDAERDRLRTVGYPDAWTFLRQGTGGR